MSDYDVRKAFEEMELELIASMRRNLARHQKWETEEGFNWNQWQAEQLKSLNNYKKKNAKTFGKKFSLVNANIKEFIEETYENDGYSEERAILEEIAEGNIVNNQIRKGVNNTFFSLNEKKMNALIKSTTDDMKVAERAMLRMANDQYRKTIFKAQVMANSGAFTMQQSVDMATKDFLKAGINCIQYKDGRRVNIATYSEMALRTANKRASLTAKGDARNALGIHTVRISRYGQCSETCLPWQGRVYVDDVYSGGTKKEAQQLNLPLLSEAMAGGLFHPNCKHTMTTYFYDLKKELGEIDGEVENSTDEQEHRKNLLHIQQQKRLATGSLDPQNVAQAKQRQEIWEKKDRLLAEDSSDDIVTNLKNKVKGIVLQDNITTFDGLPNELKDSFLTKLKTSTSSAQKLLSDIYDKVSYSYNINHLHSSAIKKLNVIYMNKVDSSTLAHELYHLLDTKYNITKNSLLKPKLEYDYSSLIKKSNGNIKDYLIEKYPNLFIIKNKNVKIKKEYRGISDIFSGLTKGEVNFGYGHSPEYWERNEYMVVREAWAQFGRIEFENNQEVTKMLNELFPNFTEYAKIMSKKVGG